jgi:hypothetical protein
VVQERGAATPVARAVHAQASDCGTVSVYLGTKYIGSVNLYAATTQRQAVIALPAQASVFSGTLKITTGPAGSSCRSTGSRYVVPEVLADSRRGRPAALRAVPPLTSNNSAGSRMKTIIIIKNGNPCH